MGHVYCRYEHAAEYRRLLTEFFAECVDAGLRTMYVSSDGLQTARADLAHVGDLDELLAAGAVQVVPAAEVYGAGGPVDPGAVLAFYAAMTEQALADGFRGLAVSADATELVRTPAQRDAFARYEFLADRYMAQHPLSGLCAYRHGLGDDVLAEFAALHPAGPSGQPPPFQVFGYPDGTLGLAGQFDPAGVATLGRLLPRLRTALGTGPLVVDLAEVEYVDHRLLRTISACSAANGGTLSLRSPPPFATRLLDLLPRTYLTRARWGAQP